MLLLRLTSPDSVIGLISDDGFEIGKVTTRTLELVQGMTALGAVNGVLYGVLRTAIPVRLRLPLWAGLWALVGGASFVHKDGIDFNLLEPAILAVALFVALPGLAAAAVVLLVERWAAPPQWANRRLTALLVVASLASTFALVVAVVVMALAFALRRSLGPAGSVRLRVARVLIPAGLVLAGAFAGIDLVRDSNSILR
jgi:hypothetical protein